MSNAMKFLVVDKSGRDYRVTVDQQQLIYRFGDEAADDNDCGTVSEWFEQEPEVGDSIELLDQAATISRLQ